MTAAPRRSPATVADVLDALLREPGRPRITWYGSDGERVELSGAVLVNWVNKTTNLLVEELDAGPGTRVLLDLPPHWRTLVWALATWRTGACTVPSGTDGTSVDGAPADVVVTHRPADHRGAADVVAVTLPALARRFDGDLPAGVLDAAADVMTYGDVIGWTPATAPEREALPGTSHADLLAATSARDAVRGARSLQRAGHGPVDASVLTDWLAALSADGSLVLVGQGAAVDVERVVATERVTVVAD